MVSEVNRDRAPRLKWVHEPDRVESVFSNQFGTSGLT